MAPLPYPLDLVAARGWAFHVEPYALNVVGVRRKRNTPKSMDDVLYLVRNANVRDQSPARPIAWEIFAFPCETEPGVLYLQAPMNPLGTAVLREGRYAGSHKRGLHHGRPAITQCGTVTVFRDANRNATVDYVGTDTGLFGINIHDVTDPNQLAGCQGLYPEHLAEILKPGGWLYEHEHRKPDADVRIDYTLIDLGA